LSIWPKQTLPF